MEFVHKLQELDIQEFSKKITTSKGVKIKGERLTFGYVHKARGTGSQPHRHPEVEQYNFVLKGQLKPWVDGEERVIGPGESVHIPANTLHSIVAVGDEDCIFLMVKDTSANPKQGTSGVPDDPNASAPRKESEQLESIDKGADSKYFHKFSESEAKLLNPKMTTTKGSRINGDRITIGLMSHALGTGAQPHRHPDVEQFMYTISGKCEVNVEGEEKVVGPGDLWHVRPNALHGNVVVGDEDWVFVVAKDVGVVPGRSIFGVPDDPTVTKPRYAEGYDPDDKK
jgi:quercetin dioxygenase-like cupin family protein